MRNTVFFNGSDFQEQPLEEIIPENMLRKEHPDIPELTELDVVRYFTNLSQKNFSVDTVFYPLGSCTMKYNPKINEKMAGLEGFTAIHPEQGEMYSQGALQLMFELQEALGEITGMDAVSLQPAAGAHGEFAGMLIVKKYFENKGENRTKVIIPDSAHGTNPASARMCGFDILEVRSNDRGQVDIEELKKLLSDDVAAIMMTNPNTLGLFEEEISRISQMAKKHGILLYYDGANLNAIMGITNPAIMGFDIVHVNLHKTFSTPHGGGGPGAGPVGVIQELADYLPVPVIGFDGEKYYFDYNLKNSIGKIKAYYGNFGIFVRAYTYILMQGGDGLKNVSENAVLNANYLKEKLKKYYKLPFDQPCMHEFVLSGVIQKEQGVNTLGIAKMLMDYGIHPPTIYFPMIVPESMMIEPTETESRETLDNFVRIMENISIDIREKKVQDIDYPLNMPVARVDEATAARKPILKYNKSRR